MDEPSSSSHCSDGAAKALPGMIEAQGLVHLNLQNVCNPARTTISLEPQVYAQVISRCLPLHPDEGSVDCSIEEM